jgi:hypothetical protein
MYSGWRLRARLRRRYLTAECQVNAGMPEPYRMGEKLIQANAVTCVVDQTTRGEAGPWSCSFAAVGR